MRSVSVKESSVRVQEEVPAGGNHDLNSDNQPEPFLETFLADLVLKQPHACERSDGTAGKRQCQQDPLRYTGSSSPWNHLVIAIAKKRNARDGQPQREK
jgi:hypothetical protein